MHHDAQIMVRSMMAADGINERYIAYQPIFLHVAAIMKRLVNHIMTHHGNENDQAHVLVK